MEELLELLAEVLVEAIPAMRERRRDRRQGGSAGLTGVPVQSSSRHGGDLDARDHRGRSYDRRGRGLSAISNG